MFLQLASLLLLPLVSSPAAEPASAALEPTKTKAPQIVSVAVRPARSKSTKKGNAIFELSLDTKPDFGAIGLSKEGKQLVAKDDGVYPDRKAGDGVFAVLTTLKEAPTKTTRGSFTSGKGEVITHGFKVKFDFVACPPDCTSLLGGSCWFCLKATEVEVGS